MKKLIFLFSFFALSTLTSSADDRANAVLETLQARLNAMGDYTAEFEVTVDGEGYSGVYAVSGQKIWMRATVQGQSGEFISDGRTRWSVNHADKEVMIDDAKFSGVSGNFTENPARAFEFAREAFDSRMEGENVVLVPRKKDDALRKIVLQVSPRTGLPSLVRYTLEGVGESVVRIKNLRKGLPADARFSFDKGRYKGYEIVDFR